MPHIDRIYIKTIFMITRVTAMYKRLLDSKKVMAIFWKLTASRIALRIGMRA